jgi:hypothetical protein
MASPWGDSRKYSLAGIAGEVGNSEVSLTFSLLKCSRNLISDSFVRDLTLGNTMRIFWVRILEMNGEIAVNRGV